MGCDSGFKNIFTGIKFNRLDDFAVKGRPVFKKLGVLRLDGIKQRGENGEGADN